jgi:WhiB family redox-sensing transcriptional regulator
MADIDSSALPGRWAAAPNGGQRVVSAKEINWRQLGACRGLEPSIFYPDDEDEALEAKTVCDQCGVRVACLEFALQSREKAGVWGGATERERRRMIRQRRRTA